MRDRLYTLGGFFERVGVGCLGNIELEDFSVVDFLANWFFWFWTC